MDEVVKSYTYAAYGYTETKGDFLNSFAFTGAVIDEETGLYYMNARYYDTQTGRFISEDSYRGTGETFWHLYAYCDGDPVNCTDLTGHAPCKKDPCVGSHRYEHYGFTIKSSNTGVSDVSVFARVMYAESTTADKGVKAVAYVVKNRRAHKGFPDTWRNALLQKGAFASVLDKNYKNPSIASSRWKDAVNVALKLLYPKTATDLPSVSYPLKEGQLYFLSNSYFAKKTRSWDKNKRTAEYSTSSGWVKIQHVHDNYGGNTFFNGTKNLMY